MTNHPNRSKVAGRHCKICGKMGGTGFAWKVFALLGFDVERGPSVYAHGTCLINFKKQLAKQSL